MTNLQMTTHACQRMSQRGLTAYDIDLIMELGRDVSDGVLITRKDCEEFERMAKAAIARVRRLEGKRVVVSDGRLVTAYHATASEQNRLMRRDRKLRRDQIDRKHPRASH